MAPTMGDDSEKRMLRRVLGVFAVPWIMVAAVVLGFLLGAYLDRKLDWAVPIATIFFVVVAVMGGGYQSYRMIMRTFRD